MRYFGVVMLLLILIGCANPNRISSRPSQAIVSEINTKDTYTHQSGLELPPQIGPFKRTNLKSFDSQAKSISAEYQMKTLGFKEAVITVYIYPADNSEQDLSYYFERSKKTLLDIYPDAYDIAEGTIKIGQPWGPQTGMALTFKYKSKKLFKKKICISNMYLFKYTDWLIKYRVTYPENNRKRVESEINTFMHLLHWPKPTENNGIEK